MSTSWEGDLHPPSLCDGEGCLTSSGRWKPRLLRHTNAAEGDIKWFLRVGTWSCGTHKRGWEEGYQMISAGRNVELRHTPNAAERRDIRCFLRVGTWTCGVLYAGSILLLWQELLQWIVLVCVKGGNSVTGRRAGSVTVHRAKDSLFTTNNTAIFLAQGTCVHQLNTDFILPRAIEQQHTIPPAHKRGIFSIFGIWSRGRLTSLGGYKKRAFTSWKGYFRYQRDS